MREKYWYTPKPKETKTCDNCGMEFETAYKHKRFCSDKCRNNDISKRYIMVSTGKSFEDSGEKIITRNGKKYLFKEL